MILAGVVVVFFSWLAFWKHDALLFMLVAGMSIMTGFYWYDIYATNTGLAIGIMLIAYSLICLIFALGCLFKRRRTSEE